jgi:hypothetical protein
MVAPVPDPKIGDVFGRLTVTGEVERYGTTLKYKRVPVTCVCGISKKIDKSNLLRGKSTSCGCFNKERTSAASTTHGKRASKIYAVWNMMRQRCNLPTNKQYPHYGGRGIEVCESWQKFENFYADMGDPPFERATLERLDNDKNYCKQNVVWATYTQQQTNTRKTVLFDFQGEKLMLKDVASRVGMKLATLSSRVYGQGLQLSEAVSRPLMTQEESGGLSGSREGVKYAGRLEGEKKY